MKPVKNVINAFTFISVAAVVVMLVITFVDIIGRLVFAKPVIGATEICQILMAVILTAMGGSLLARKTVQVDVLLDALPKKISLKIDTGVLTATVIFCFLVGYATFLNGQYALNTGRVYTFLKVPLWPFLMLLAFSFMVAGIATVFYIINLHKDKDKKKDVLDHSDLAILEEADS